MEVDQNWEALCPVFQFGNASPWVVWDVSVDDIVYCWQLIFSTVFHALFLIINAYYLGYKMVFPISAVESRGTARLVFVSWIFRLIGSSCLAVIAIIFFALQLKSSVDTDTVGMIFFANFSVGILAWITHSALLFSKIRQPKRHISYLSLFLFWIPIFILAVLRLRSVLLGHYSDVVDRTIAFVSFGFHAFYLSASGLHLFAACLFVESDKDRTARETADERALLDDQTARLPGLVLGTPKPGGLVERLLFIWVDPLMQFGAAGRLRDVTDLFDLPAPLKAIRHSARLTPALAKNPKTSRVYLITVLMKLWGLRWLVLGIMKLSFSVLQFTSPLFVNWLVASVEDPEEGRTYMAYLYGFGLIFVNTAAAFFQLHYVFIVEKLAICVRGALIDAVYENLLKVHSSAISESMASGQVINLVGTDCQKTAENFLFVHQLWALPLQIGVSLYLLYREVGFAFIGGLLFSILLIPINQVIANKISKQVEENLKQRDLRVKLMSEGLSAIRIIKYHAWEKWFSKKVSDVRNDEMKTVRYVKYLDALCVYFWATTPVIMAVSTFATYVLMGGLLTASKVFTCVSIFGMVLAPLNAIPWIITGTVESWISIKRLQKFFKLTRLDPETHYSPFNEPDIAVRTDGASFSWSDPMSVAVHAQLQNLDIVIKKGAFVGVLGRVGSGKSSFLNAIVGELHRTGGSIAVASEDLTNGFGYVPQDNWIQQGTVQSNICFCKDLHNSEFYRAVIEACALREDLDRMASGDLTRIGEHGVTLSGGQKARIALARAIYQAKDLILLDDPLSAVDPQVANHIFRNCIMGLLQGKTRILVTHHAAFVRDADLVICLKDGEVAYFGPPRDLFEGTVGNEVSQLVASQLDGHDDHSGGDRSVESIAKAVAEPFGENLLEDNSTKTGAKVNAELPEEEREFGTLKLGVWAKYWKAVGNFWGICVLVSLLLMQASYNVNDWWLSYWVTHSKTFIDPVTNHTTTDYKFYLAVYGGIGAGNSFFALVRSFVFAFAGLRAAYIMHDLLLSRVTRARIGFFDVTPSGQILNRFAKDVTAVDNQLPFMLNILLACVFQLLGTLMVICYGLPWFILLLIPITPLYYFIQRFYRSTSREIKRIYTLTESPIYTMFSETLHGLATVRAMRATTYFHEKYRRLLDDHLRAQFADISANKWLNTRLQLLGLTVITGVVLIGLTAKLDASLIGLTISYSLTVIGVLNNLVTSLIETEKEMVSVERISQYLDNVDEENYEGVSEPDNYWPRYGEIRFENVRLKYRPELPDALANITLQIIPGERIGIVGRTGAGKSSFITTLFRSTELTNGQIIVDGVDIRTVPLQRLRSSLALIPQSPSLFDASIRANIDPLGVYPDEELWRVVDLCHLRGVIDKLGGTLEVPVGENGRKLSSGQKQLVCLARALLTKAKIICLDEATASVDYETDSLIQRTLREALSGTTLITIAHRLQTVIDYNRIVVMAAGRIVESGEPRVLLSRPGSFFSVMYAETTRTGSSSR